jgi:hypothetical protein
LRRTYHLVFAILLSSSAADAGLLTSFQQVGHLALEVAGVATGNRLVATGTLKLSRLPPTATPLKATLYASQVNNGAGLDAVFAGTNLGSVGPAAGDAAAQAYYAYQWDVTALIVPGVTSYSFTIGQATLAGTIPGVALAVAWEDGLEPTRLVSLIDGMQQVGEIGPETESAPFTGLGAGQTTLWLFTVYDDQTNTGEVIAYNGSGIGGPIDQNLGVIASLTRLETDSVDGTNTLSITTGTDHMGWMVAAASVTIPPVGVFTTTWQRVKELYR